MSDERRSADLVLAPNEFAYISDRTKGHVNVYVGPHKTSLADTDQPVLFDDKSKRFTPTSLSGATQSFQIAPEGWYIALKNPSKDGHPAKGSAADKADLQIGQKVNIPGPTSFALYPGQMANVIPGHNLKSNEYLLARIYDEEAASENWKTSAIIKTTESVSTDSSSGSEESEAVSTLKKFTTGDLLIIKGTEVSFFIPPTGIEVLKDDKDRYVREAVTLELLEYCILLDQNGKKRYEIGPQVVFPEPTEIFLSKWNKEKEKRYNKFRAIELNVNSGIYIKVIADYEESGQEFVKGDELFITGKEQKIYFPREEHAIIKYGDEEISFGIAIPKGEARYVLNRDTGDIRTEKGPKVFLPDPRKEVIVRRMLDQRTCSVMFPDNNEALQYNLGLAAQFQTYSDSDDMVEAGFARAAAPGAMYSASLSDSIEEGSKRRNYRRRGHSRDFGGDTINRKTEYTKPRTITLDTKYEGAITVEPWTGYAVMIVGKDGSRRVEVGPKTIILEYDEKLQMMELSTGKPKSDTKLLSDVYLRIMNNKVSDLVTAETKDFCRVSILTSYRVDFVGDARKWFNVENYVKFLTDHLRSRIRNTVMRMGVEDFYKNSSDVIRDAILGAKTENDDGTFSRAGMTFQENGMQISDVEILDVKLADSDIQQLLVDSQRDVINQTLRLNAEYRKLDVSKEMEIINQKMIAAKAETHKKLNEIKIDEIKDRLTVNLTDIDATNQVTAKEQQAKIESQSALTSIANAEMERDKALADLKAEIKDRFISQQKTELESETESLVKKATAISPELIAALQAFGDKELIERVSAAIGPMAILDLAGGKSVADILKRLFEGTSLANALPSPQSNGNGKHPQA